MMGTLGKWLPWLGLAVSVAGATSACAGAGSYRALLPGLDVGASQSRAVAGGFGSDVQPGWRRQEMALWLVLTWVPEQALSAAAEWEEARCRVRRARSRVIAGFAGLERRWCRPGQERCRRLLLRIRDEILGQWPEP